MKIFVGADHRGFELKEKIKQWLREWEHEVIDMGADSFEAQDDYPDYATAVAQAVSRGEGQGVLVCGSGHGVDIVANKFKGVRSIVGFNVQVVRQGREHEDANVLSLPSDWVSEAEAREMVKLFVETGASQEERHRRRREKIGAIDQ